MGKVIKFPHKSVSDFREETERQLRFIADCIKDDEFEPPIEKVIFGIKQGGDYIFGTYGEIDKGETLKILTELRCYLIDVEV